MNLRLNKFFFFFILIFFSLCDIPLWSQSKTDFEQIKLIKERLLYEVRYGPFLLGYVDIEPIQDTVYQGIPAQKYKMVMRSNPHLIFVGDKMEVFYSIFAMRGNQVFGLVYQNDDLDSDIPEELLMKVNLNEEKIQISMHPEKDEFLEREYPWQPFALLGPEIYHYSRFYAGKDTMISSPIYVDTLLKDISLDFRSITEKRSYKAFPEPILTYKMFGNAPFSGPFGFNGNLTAWHKADSLRLPLEAHVSVWIGSVKVRLIHYERLDSPKSNSKK